MDYTELKIYTKHEWVDPLTCVLTDMGIAGFAVSDPADFEELLEKKNEYDWDYINEAILPRPDEPVCVTLYFEDNPAGLELLDSVLEEIRPYTEQGAELRSVSDDDWKDKWKEYFKPTLVSERIVVKPSWEEYTPSRRDEIVIELDPGMAFGTGTHPTTSLCIGLLETWQKPGDFVLDVGCGSGILSIAAQKLGAGSVLGVDIDPVAVEVSLENVARNHAQEEITIVTGDLTKGLSVTADVVAANLMADLVIRLSRDVAKHMKHGGVYISSGILLEKQAAVVSAIEEAGFAILEIREKEEWCAIAARYTGKGRETR